MPLPPSFIAISDAVRPQILKMARRETLVDDAFKAFRARVYPDASADQCAMMRIAFMAGAAELLALITYASDTASDDATDADLAMMEGISNEIERAYERILRTASANRGQRQ